MEGKSLCKQSALDRPTRITMESTYVFFYGHSPSKYARGVKHYVLSQWHPCSFVEHGVMYTTAEQYMMAKKAELFEDADALRAIMASTDPRAIKKLGRMVRGFDADRWTAVAYEIVVRANRLKFSQDTDLRDVLLSTSDALIVEASPTDRIWGIGLSATKAREMPADQWPGTNLLGRALTQVRDELVNDHGML